MFLAKWNEINNGECKEVCYIYYKNSNGYREYCKDTFSPLIEDLRVLDLSVKGKTYEEKKQSLYDLAIEYQYNFAPLSWSYGELYELNNFFEKNAKRYGLLKEFKENAIC